MVTNKTYRKLQERYEASAKALFGAAREVAELKRKLDVERSAREDLQRELDLAHIFNRNVEKHVDELELRIKSLTRTIADVEEILHDA